VRENKIILIFGLVAFFALQSFSQQRTDFVDVNKLPLKERIKKKLERKISLRPYLGIGVFPANLNLNGLGLARNIYAGFTPGLAIGLGANYKYNENISLTADISNMYAWRNYYSSNIISVNIGAKYYLLGTKKKFSPYISAGFNLSMVNINREAHTTIVTKNQIDTNITEIKFGTPTEIEYRHTDIQVLFGPLLGVFASAGVDYDINKKYGVFLQANFNPSLTQPSDFQDDFPGSSDELQYFSFSAGATIKLYKKKPPEIDTNMIFIPDDLIALSVPEDHDEGRLLVREGVFDVMLREGLGHNVKVGIGNHEILIDEEVQDPCNVTCYLYDDKGDIIATAQSTPEGKLVFSDLEKGVYDLVFVLDKPCQSANFKYKFPDPDVHTLMQYNTEGGMSDSLTYNIEGIIQIPDSAEYNFIYRSSSLFVKNNDKFNKQNYDITVMLSDEKNQIIKHFDPYKDEKFAFKKLTPAAYDIIYKVPDVELHTGFVYTIYDNYKKPLKKLTTDSKCDSILVAESEKNDSPKFTMKGKITFLDSLTKPEDVTLYLVNCFKKIESSKKPNSDGTFSFSNLRSKKDYSVFYELKNSLSKIDLLYRIEDPISAYNANLGIETKVIAVDIQTWNENTEYDIQGSTTNLKGYAVQVGASDNIKSVNHLCKKLLDDGFNPVSIQVLGTGSTNRRFAYSKNFKLFKVLVGAFPDEKLATKEKFKLDFYGYDAYVVKHLE
jgi:outer membrane protein W